MGDGADFALDCAMEDMESFWEWDSSGRDIQDGIDRGILNDYGGLEYYPVIYSKGGSFGKMSTKPSGPGKCPLCSNPTTLKSGKFGKFYGCLQFPKCSGSRKY